MPAQRRAKSRRTKAREPFLNRIRKPDLHLPGLASLNWRRVGLGFGFLAAAFSLLALVAPGGGAVTREWSAFLLRLFGWSAYLFPFAVAALLYLLGVRRRRLDPARALGAAQLWLLALALTHLSARLPNPFTVGATNYGGGWLGWVLADALDLYFGRVGAFLVGFVLALIGAMLLSQVTPRQAWTTGRAELTARLNALRQRSSQSRPRPRRRKRPAAGTAAASPVLEPAELAAEPALDAVTSGPAGDSRPLPIADAEPPARRGRSRPAPAGVPPIVREPAVLASESDWELPDPTGIFEPEAAVEISDEEIRERADLIEQTLFTLASPAHVVQVERGPTITSYGVQPGYHERRSADGKARRTRVRVSKIMSLENDLALALAARRVRITGPVPGRDVISVEVPNRQVQTVSLGGVLASPEFQRHTSPLTLALGRGVSGRPLLAELSRMPHLLMAGATGSGKSVAVNAIISCLLCRNTPDMLRFVLIDPKKVELAAYRGIPHLIGDVVSEPDDAVGAIKWAGREMDRRYTAFHEAGAGDLRSYNDIMRREGNRPLPVIVLIVDELADLMMHAMYDVEPALARVAQMSRATGIHLIIATQRPSVDVVTGLIKANFPARIAFNVSSNTDSRVILDSAGAEKLMGRGDLLYMSPSSHRPVRAQGCWVSDTEIERLVAYWKRSGVDFDRDDQFVQAKLWSASTDDEEDEDDLLDKALEAIVQEQRASTTLIQRHLRVGYTRAARILETLIARGVVSKEVDGPYGSHSVLLETDSEPEPDSETELDPDPEPDTEEA